MLQAADEIIYVDRLEEYRLKDLLVNVYHPAKMHMRNCWMVDKSDYIIGVWNHSA